MTGQSSPPPDLERVRRLIESTPWTWAKSYADSAPHQYTVRPKFVAAGNSHADFNWLIQHIYDTGWRGRWHQTRNRYLTVETDDGQHHYWCMGWPAAETIVLNRADVNGDRRSLAEPVGEPRACQAITKAGKPCKNMTDSPRLYCHAHADRGPEMTELAQLQLLGEHDHDYDWEAP